MIREYNKFYRTRKALMLVLCIVFINACGSIIAPYNETAYQYSTNLKVESLALMDKATEPYNEHQQKVEELMIKIGQAYEFSKGLPKNVLSTKQWGIMQDPDGNMLGGFIERWRKRVTMSEVFVKEAKGQISKGFDQIIELESAKIKD